MIFPLHKDRGQMVGGKQKLLGCKIVVDQYKNIDHTDPVSMMKTDSENTISSN